MSPWIFHALSKWSNGTESPDTGHHQGVWKHRGRPGATIDNLSGSTHVVPMAVVSTAPWARFMASTTQLSDYVLPTIHEFGLRS